MAQAINYHDQEAGSSLDDDIEKCREEFEVEICRSDRDPESDLHRVECKKNPDHVRFIPEPEFTIEHLPVEWRDPEIYKAIRALALNVVHLSVQYTSPDRPDGDPFSAIRGSGLTRYGTGSVHFPHDFQNRQQKQCPLKNCKVPHPHNVTPEFYVTTASHVVFDSSELEQTEIRFCFDSKDDTKGKAKVTAQGLRIIKSTGRLGEFCAFTCVSHNLNIVDLCLSGIEKGELKPTPSSFDTQEKKPEPQFSLTGTKEKIHEKPLSSSNEEEKKPKQTLDSPHTEEKKPKQPLGSPHTEEKKPEPPLRDTNSKIREPLVVIVSHPHGCSKHVSTGEWTGVTSVQSVMMKQTVNRTLRSLINPEVMRQAGCPPDLLEFMDMNPDLTVRHLLQAIGISSREFSDKDISHDLALLITCPFTLNEITHMMLVAMWEKTTSNSTIMEQVSEKELAEIAWSVVDDITSIKSSRAKGKICVYLLSLWKILTSDSRFSRQLCKEEFSEICKLVVNDGSGTNSLPLKEILKKVCSSWTLEAGMTMKFYESFLLNEGVRLKDEANLLGNMTLAQMFEKGADNILKNHDLDRMLYSAETCPGSSGAPVFLFYDDHKGRDFAFSTHFGTNKGNNMSVEDFSICSLFEKVKPTDKLKQEARQDDKPLD